MSLEDVFVAIVDQAAERRDRYERSAQRAPRRTRAEQELAKTITEKKTQSEGGEYSALFDEDN